MKVEHIATILRTTPQTLQQTLAPYDNEIAQWHPSPDDWCINDVLGHLIEADKHAFAARISLILSEDNPTIPRWNPNKAAKERHDCAKNVHDLLADLAEQRIKSAEFVMNLDLSKLERMGTYPSFGEFNASDFLYEWPYHDFEHIQQILDNLKAQMLPLMSETMRTALNG